MNRSSASASPAEPLFVERLLDEGPRLRALALSLVRDPHEADDLVQETWTRALERPPRHAASVGGWLATVLRNLVRDRSRVDGRRARRERAVADTEPAPSAASLAAQADAHRRLLAAVLALDEPYRETVLLRFFEGLGPKEIGERTGTPAATVRSRLHRALGRLRDELEDDLGADWRRALVPALPVGVGVLESSGGTELLRTGVSIVTTKQKLTAAALLVLLLLAGGAALTHEPEPTTSSAAAPGEAPTRRAEPPVQRRPRGAERADEQGAVVDAPAAPPATPETTESPAQSPVAPVRVAVEARLVDRLPAAGERTGAGDAQASDGATISTSGGGFGRLQGVPVSPWDFVKPRGDATLRGRVLGVDGAPVPGASVLRVHLDEDDVPIVRHGGIHFDFVGSTEADGTFAFSDQPTGRWMLVGDFRQMQRVGGQLNVERGRVIELADGETRADVELRVPVEAAGFGSVTVTLTDPLDRPLEGVLVTLPPQALITDTGGVVTFLGIEPGDHIVQVRSRELRLPDRTVSVTPRSEQQLQLVTEYEDTGTLAFGGRVVDDRGEPLAGARVYLGRQGVSRNGRTDADGRFRFADLPPAMSAEPVVLWAYPDATLRTHSAFRMDLQLPAPDVEAIAPRHATLHLHLRDAVSGDPVSVCQLKPRLVATPDGATRDTELPGSVGHTDEGLLIVRGPPGTLRLSIDSPEHQGVIVEVDLPNADDAFETTVELQPLP